MMDERKEGRVEEIRIPLGIAIETSFEAASPWDYPTTKPQRSTTSGVPTYTTSLNDVFYWLLG